LCVVYVRPIRWEVLQSLFYHHLQFWVEGSSLLLEENQGLMSNQDIFLNQEKGKSNLKVILAQFLKVSQGNTEIKEKIQEDDNKNK